MLRLDVMNISFTIAFKSLLGDMAGLDSVAMLRRTAALEGYKRPSLEI